MSKTKSDKKKFLFILLGLGLILFAIIPTPDDVTVISPVLAFTAGLALIGFKGLK